MSYYILPKSNNFIKINLKTSSYELPPLISQSLYNYYHETKRLLISTCLNEQDSSFNVFTELLKIINPYEYIYSKVPGSTYSVSKVKSTSNFFYEIIELIYTLNVFDLLKCYPMKILHIGLNSNDSVDYFDLIRGHMNDSHINFNTINNNLHKYVNDIKFDLMIIEIDKETFFDLNSYTIYLLKIIMLIIQNQNIDGTLIIKVDHVFHKPIIDVIYILSSFYEKVLTIKPNTSNVTTFEKYIVCKNFIVDEKRAEFYKKNHNDIFFFMNSYSVGNISSIIDCEVPSFFVNKINDVNITLGQQQLESFDQLFNILKNKNRYDKIELIKKTNIQKSVVWCEKNKIPCNKFTEKINIFLPL